MEGGEAHSEDLPKLMGSHMSFGSSVPVLICDAVQPSLVSALLKC